MWKFMQNKSKFGEPEASWQLMHAKTLQQTPVTKIKVYFMIVLKIFKIILVIIK
jgi:hypothetical protein